MSLSVLYGWLDRPMLFHVTSVSTHTQSCIIRHTETYSYTDEMMLGHSYHTQCRAVSGKQEAGEMLTDAECCADRGVDDDKRAMHPTV